MYTDGNASASENSTDSTAKHANDSAPADARPDGEQGPPTDVPEQVPDHVVQIHQTISEFLDGAIDHLGSAVSDIVGEDGDADDAESENETDDSIDGEKVEDADTARRPKPLAAATTIREPTTTATTRSPTTRKTIRTIATTQTRNAPTDPRRPVRRGSDARLTVRPSLHTSAGSERQHRTGAALERRSNR